MSSAGDEFGDRVCKALSIVQIQVGHPMTSKLDSATAKENLNRERTDVEVWILRRRRLITDVWWGNAS
jgi:hypothetical protein